MLMQIPLPVGVLIQVREDKTCFQLAAQLFFQRMGKLDSVVSLHHLLIQLRVPQRIVGQRMGNGGFLLVKI